MTKFINFGYFVMQKEINLAVLLTRSPELKMQMQM